MLDGLVAGSTAERVGLLAGLAASDPVRRCLLLGDLDLVEGELVLGFWVLRY